MLNEKNQKQFEEMVEEGIRNNVWRNPSVEDLSELNSDEQDHIPLLDIEPERKYYKGKQHIFQEDWMNWNKRQNPEPPSTVNDAIEKPSHYHFFGEDTMPMIEKILDTAGYLGFLKGNALKYRLRVGKKEGNSISNDVAKAIYYEKLYNDFVKENTP